MPVRHRSRFRFAFVPALGLVAALSLSGKAQPPEPARKPVDSKTEPKTAPAPKELPGIRLPDGTFLWYGPGDGDERVSLTPQELRKLQEQINQLKKQLAARKAVPPSGCAIRGRVEKRGEQLVAILKLTLSFRTTTAQTPVALGGKKAFLVAAALDGARLPILETVEDGFAAVIETTGDHTLTLDLEASVTARGAKPELGFEIGLPRAAITTLALDPPDPAVKRVNLSLRAPDATTPTRPETRRVPALDVKQLAARSGQEGGYPLGPVESVEVTWEPPAAAAQPADRVQSAELDIAVLFTEAIVETTAKFTLHGPAREWKLVAPASATVSADRAASAPETGTSQSPTITKPASAARPEWKIEFPAGTSPADWVITAVTRQTRPRAEDPKHRGPFPVGPFAVLDVLRQTGTVRVSAGPHTRFVFKHGPDLHRDVAPGPVIDEGTSAFLRLTTGPTGNLAVNAPLLTVEAWRLVGRVTVKPVYKLTLTEAGWKVRAEVKVTPIDTEINELAVEFPLDWRGLDPAPAELVEGVQPGPADGFWERLAEEMVSDARRLVHIHFAAGQKPPYDLILTATVPVTPGASDATIALPRFPGSIERDASLTATVSEGLEVRGEMRGWEGERAAAWGTPLSAPTGNGKSSKAVTTVAGQSEGGLARAVLSWRPYRPDLAADIRADVTLFDRQLVIQEVIHLRSPDGLPRTIRFRGPPEAAGLQVQSTQFPLEPVGPGEWKLAVPVDAKNFTVSASYAIPLPARSTADAAPLSVPVGLLWPIPATRAETTVRVWSNTVSGHTITHRSEGWRELPIEPVADRDALPVLVLAASSAEPALVLEATAVSGGSAVAVWVDRGLIQAWSADEGATRYRARFLVRRWLAPAVDIRLPGPLAGPTPEFLRDGQRIDATAVADRDGEPVYRLSLPGPRPGRTALVEVRYQLAAGRNGDTEYLPPQLEAAAFAGPVRWQVTVPPGMVPLLSKGGLSEVRWRIRNGLVVPAAVGSSEELERWLQSGEEPHGLDDASDTVTARQTAPGTLVVHRVPRIGFTIACSVAVFLLYLLLTRLSVAAMGSAVAVTAGVIAVLAVVWPHPAAEAASAGQFGLAVVVVVVLYQLAARWQYRHRVTHLPGFARSLPEPPAPSGSAKGPSTARNRPAPVGSTGSAPAVPAGG